MTSQRRTWIKSQVEQDYADGKLDQLSMEQRFAQLDQITGQDEPAWTAAYDGRPKAVGSSPNRYTAQSSTTESKMSLVAVLQGLGWLSIILGGLSGLSVMTDYFGAGLQLILSSLIGGVVLIALGAILEALRDIRKHGS